MNKIDEDIQTLRNHVCWVKSKNVKQAIETILDLYEKQKEKDLEYILNCYEEIHQKLLKDLINGNQKEKIKGLSEDL